MLSKTKYSLAVPFCLITILFCLSCSEAPIAEVEHQEDSSSGHDVGLSTEDTPGSGLSKKQDKVAICHKGETITVAISALSAHLAHGDTEGPCPGCFVFFDDELAFLDAVKGPLSFESFEDLTTVDYVNETITTSSEDFSVTVSQYCSDCEPPSLNSALGISDNSNPNNPHSTHGTKYLIWHAKDGSGTIVFKFGKEIIAFGVTITDAIDGRNYSTLTISMDSGVSFTKVLEGPLLTGTESFIGVIACVPFKEITIGHEINESYADIMGLDGIHY